MSNAQKNLSYRLSDMLDYTDEYIKLRDDVDVCFFPSRSKKSVAVKYLDIFSGMFIKKDKRQLSTVIANDLNNVNRGIDKMRETLSLIKSGKVDTPIYDEIKLINRETDYDKFL